MRDHGCDFLERCIRCPLERRLASKPERRVSLVNAVDEVTDKIQRRVHNPQQRPLF
jgi:hypothetical protein